jgi:hypothetical protein
MLAIFDIDYHDQPTIPIVRLAVPTHLGHPPPLAQILFLFRNKINCRTHPLNPGKFAIYPRHCAIAEHPVRPQSMTGSGWPAPQSVNLKSPMKPRIIFSRLLVLIVVRGM